MIWVVCLLICTVLVVVIRAIYNKAVFTRTTCCGKPMTPDKKHNWSHIQNHLIADALANGMG